MEPRQDVIFHVICQMITNVGVPPFNAPNDLAFNLQFLLHLLHLEPILSGCQSLCPPQLITKPSCFSAMFAEGVREPFNQRNLLTLEPELLISFLQVRKQSIINSFKLCLLQKIKKHLNRHIHRLFQPPVYSMDSPSIQVHKAIYWGF